MMYKYYSHLGFSQSTNNEEGKYIHNEIFNNIPHFIKNCLHVDFLKYDFVMYKDKVIICKGGVIIPITGFMMPVDLCQKNYPLLILQLIT